MTTCFFCTGFSAPFTAALPSAPRQLGRAVGIIIIAARHPGDALQLAARHRIDADADRVHDELGVSFGQRLRGGAWIGLAGLLAVADQHDGARRAFLAAQVLRRQRQRIGDRRIALRLQRASLIDDGRLVRAAVLNDVSRLVSLQSFFDVGDWCP